MAAPHVPRVRWPGMRGILPALLGLLCASLAIASLAPAPPSTVSYVAGGTLVVKEQSQPAAVDSGALACTDDGLGIGGGCIPFGPWDSIRVQDAVSGLKVAFQVCIDNDGDGQCAGEQQGGACSDDQFFSHHDDGRFFNPLGPLPKGFKTGCPGGAWQGYVVFLCEGVHVPVRPPGPPHGHAATEGSISGALDGTGYGNFCQPTGFQTKAYVVV